MNKEKIAVAKKTALEFLNYIKEYEKAIESVKNDPYPSDYPRERGMIKHGSMLLTRRLADMRKPG